MRAFVWGPAEFVGLPPRRLTAQGLIVGFLGAGAIIGAGALGMWAGPPALSSGEAGIAVTCVLASYLFAIRAGRALVGVVALLGICLALLTPQTAAGLILAHRDQEQQALVTVVEGTDASAAGRERYLCSVQGSDGSPLSVRIWRGCRESTQPGDTLAVVYDPLGRVAPRGAEGARPDGKPLAKLGVLALALVAVSTVAVARSFRLSTPSYEDSDTPKGGRGPATLC
ncbi:hypothetical protein AB0I66_11145 [Streptomyces sp. NPDC050439]|uniref:hypothetical protein n=1 Tax=unclassified Streptomyces TaxID=2593676 RepID=UPI003416F82B